VAVNGQGHGLETNPKATVEEVRELLLRAFPGADVSGVDEAADHRITGVVRWAKFRDMADKERFRLVAEKVRDPLGLRGANLGALFLMAPGEKL